MERVDEYKQGLENDPDRICFKCRVNDKYDEIVAYNDVINFIEDDDMWDGMWKFREILDHKRVYLHQKDQYKGSSYNLLIEWETGERTWEPLYTKDGKGIHQTDPVTVAIYAKKNNLIDTQGWKLPNIKKLCKTQERIIRRANQAKLHSFRTKPVYQYGYLVPHNHEQAMEIDRKNGNTKWRDAELYEIGCVDEYNVFDDKGKGYNPGPDYKKIRVHMVYAVKHNGKHRARLVAGGHLTDTPIDSVYSSVVSLRGIRILAFLAELNELELWATDIGSAYLKSYTKEKVYIVAGPEFGARQGHTLIIIRALYGLKSSGLQWHERLSDVLRAMGFFPSLAEPDIWMRKVDDHYEYIAVYVDDLLIASKNPKEIVDALTNEYKFKLKGSAPVSFHLGCDWFHDEDGNPCFAPKQYIIKMIATCERLFGRKPKPYASPLRKGDHPEIDDSDLLDLAGAKEEVLDDAPPPLGKEVLMTSFFDANLYHDVISGKSVTGILHMFNKTPIDWFSKLQGTVESATFGSEYVAAKTCTEQIIALRLTLRYLGVPIKGSTMVFGDNETVINTASTPHARLQKRHNALSYHKARSSHAARRSRELGIQESSLREHWEMVLLLIVDRNPMKKGKVHIKDIVLARLILTWSAAAKEENQARATTGSFVLCCTLSRTWTRKECRVRPT
jgi:Reverse transcriptase (RNA-dependent DNA polymerase)